jgi:hypothetical protein
MKQEHKKLIFVLYFIVFLAMINCESTKNDGLVFVDSSAQFTYDNTKTYQYFLFETTDNVNLTYELDLLGQTKDVYFIFTNTNISINHAAPSFLSSYMNSEFDDQRSSISTTESEPMNPPTEVAMRGKPEITEFNSQPLDANLTDKFDSGASRNVFISPEEPRLDTEGEAKSFILDKYYTSINATCRKVATNGTKTLNIYVADNEWNNPVTQTMIDTLADKFLKNDPNNDIYDWVTNIYGEEWGSHSFNYLITPTTTNNNITILFLDIDDDNDASGTVGYFYAKDNYKTTSLGWSNARLMFYMDSNALAQKDGGTWNITDRWPSQTVSTLAHEFQHMIHFYQKIVKNNLSSNSEAWLDEMCSMVTEDLVASKVQVDGPRGVDYTTASGSSPINSNSRLDEYNYYNYYSVATWPSYDAPIEEILAHYGNKYAFGAYLARNYNGASLFRKIVQNSYLNHDAVTNALNSEGYSEDFGTALRKWGIANLLSDQEDTITGFVYNIGNTWMNSIVGSITYSLGSINLFAYTPQPTIWHINGNFPELRKSSNMYIYAGSLTGLNSWEIQMTSDVKLSIVIK